MQELVEKIGENSEGPAQGGRGGAMLNGAVRRGEHEFERAPSRVEAEEPYRPVSRPVKRLEAVHDSTSG
jgi:hypothetical protein